MDTEEVAAPAPSQPIVARNRLIGVFRNKSETNDGAGPPKETHAFEQVEVSDRLLKTVKKEVKQIMEEAVTRKFVHEESSTITSLCAAVDACLSHGLRRRALGLFKTNSTTALLQKIAKSFPPAFEVVQIVERIEHIQDGNKRSSSSGDSTSGTPQRQATSSASGSGKNRSVAAVGIRYLWIRVALFEKHLAKLVDYLVENASKYYEKDALVADPVSGQILASLLVGPCALDYSRMKTQDHFWTDPPADELLQRHKLSNALGGSIMPQQNRQGTHPKPTTPPNASKRPTLSYRRAAGSSSEDSVSGRVFQSGPGTGSGSTGSVGSVGTNQARDYVESLHQNPRSTLIYGKNNVVVHPHNCPEPLRGYLSLHHEPSAAGLVLKWTPNQLMNGSGDSTTGAPCEYSNGSAATHSIYWEHAIKVKMSEVVYLHCHQNADQEGSLVLVGQDGVQRPPIVFPKGDSRQLLQFLACLEGALLPLSRLDPPLATQTIHSNHTGGKVLAKLKRQSMPASNEQDLVFRVIHGHGHKSSVMSQQTSSSSSDESVDADEAIEIEPIVAEDRKKERPKNSAEITKLGDESLEALCSTMKRQILSRAFYGWLAHCRHLCTVRTHLSGLVHPLAAPATDQPLSCTRWQELLANDGSIRDPQEVLRLVYFGGVEPNLRSKVWPYLLGHYKMSYTYKECHQKDNKSQEAFETTMSEWLAAEAIVRQRDKETAAALRLSSGGSTTQCSEIPLAMSHALSSDNNDVFEDDSAITEGNEATKSTILDENHADSNVVVSGVLECTTKLSCEENDLEDNYNDNPEENENERTSAGDQAAFGCLQGPELSNSLSLHELTVEPRSECASPASSSGAAFTSDLLDLFGLNMHRIDKDVRRCDRNVSYFENGDNLDKLRNVMCTYVWEHLDVGYVQGMCDLAAPLLAVFDDEVMTYSCFCELMKRMAANFPHGGAMDEHFANMRSLIQILDNEMFSLMQQNGDYTHFYFCYRWFLLDFKRELVYDDVFQVWETIWAAQHVASPSFGLFVALAMVKYYREIILENRMDFTDIIRFFNEMAERHDTTAILNIARQLVLEIQNLIDTSK
ncbi:small G protein signaling modulator 2-like [Varroa jacobsoni]|uniref:small G protein signaling modulator 2-like n=1 Tax=Varroa jacobsoni TaxID=62625 RepID=UPI000BF75892|nr:small G protein signaling modulator 2-like [Varroa jacobsoni]